MVTQIKARVQCNQSPKCQNQECMHAKEHRHNQNCKGEVCPLVNEIVDCRTVREPSESFELAKWLVGEVGRC
jgi:hypothetical protein